MKFNLLIDLSLSLFQIQCRRVYEILRLRVTDLSNAEDYKSYRLEVKKRLNVPFQVYCSMYCYIPRET